MRARAARRRARPLAAGFHVERLERLVDLGDELRVGVHIVDDRELELAPRVDVLGPFPAPLRELIVDSFRPGQERGLAGVELLPGWRSRPW